MRKTKRVLFAGLFLILGVLLNSWLTKQLKESTTTDVSRLEKIDVGPLNLKVQVSARNSEKWVSDPFRVGFELTRSTFAEQHFKSIEAYSTGGRASGRITVVTRNEGFPDDLIEGEKYVLDLQRTSTGIWEVVQAHRGVLCSR